MSSGTYNSAYVDEKRDSQETSFGGVEEKHKGFRSVYYKILNKIVATPSVN